TFIYGEYGRACTVQQSDAMTPRAAARPTGIGSLRGHRPLTPDERLDLVRRHRRAEQEPLAEHAAVGSQEAPLALGFDAFGQWRQAEVAGELDDAVDHRYRVGLERRAGHERPVDLDGGDRDAIESAQRRVAG